LSHYFLDSLGGNNWEGWWGRRYHLRLHQQVVRQQCLTLLSNNLHDIIFFHLCEKDIDVGGIIGGGAHAGAETVWRSLPTGEADKNGFVPVLLIKSIGRLSQKCLVYQGKTLGIAGTDPEDDCFALYCSGY